MKQEKRLYMDFHIIQTVPPSCVNRDDTGSPKTAVYGGVQRARVSSQSWKRAIRQMFQEDFSENELGVRTQTIADMILKEALIIKPSESKDELSALIEKMLNKCKQKPSQKNGIKLNDEGKTEVLIFVNHHQVYSLAKLILENENPTKKQIEMAFNQNHGIDIALFGRMVAADPELNAEASAQVAHSISTHRVDNEYDYFTAVDDLAPEDNAGAGMIGVVEFNSSTMYRYATVALHELHQELGAEGEVTAKAVSAFAKAFITSMPTGKQNTFANRTLPDAVLITLRKDQPINFVGAFEKPVRSSEEGYAQPSIRRLREYADQIYATFADAPDKSWSIGMVETQPVKLVDILSDIQETVARDLRVME